MSDRVRGQGRRTPPPAGVPLPAADGPLDVPDPAGRQLRGDPPAAPREAGTDGRPGRREVPPAARDRLGGIVRRGGAALPRPGDDERPAGHAEAGAVGRRSALTDWIRRLIAPSIELAALEQLDPDVAFVIAMGLDPAAVVRRASKRTAYAELLAVTSPVVDTFHPPDTVAGPFAFVYAHGDTEADGTAVYTYTYASVHPLFDTEAIA